MTALFLVVIMGVAALAIDLGMQRVARRDMQALVDLVALDMARQLDGITRAGDLVTSSEWALAQQQSIARNGDTLGDPPTVVVAVGHLDDPTASEPTIRPFVEAVATDIPTAVRVTASTAVSFAFRSGRGGVIASAVAEPMRTACFALGSYAARFRTGDAALLNDLEDVIDDFLKMPSGSLDVLDYQGIGNASVSVAELAAAAHAGSPAGFLTTQTTLGDLIEATIVALGRQNPVNTLAISGLDRILQGHASLSTPVLLTNVIKVQPTDAAALQTRFNVLDIVTGAALVADGTHAVDITNLAAQVPGVGSPRAESSLWLIEGPQQGCGIAGGMAEPVTTAQLGGHLYFDFSVSSLNQVPGIQGAVQTPKANVDVTIAVAAAEGRLVLPAPTCRSATVADPDTSHVEVRSGAATFTASTTLHLAGRIGLPIGPLGANVLVEVTFDQVATTGLPLPASTGTADLAIPPNDSTPVSVGSPRGPLGNFAIASTATNVKVTTVVPGFTATALNSMAAATLNASGGAAANIATNTSLTGPLNVLVGNINALMTPIRTALGLQVAGADVYAVGRPVCNGTALRG